MARIQQLTITDDTTGLFNVRHLYNVLDLELKRSARHTAVLLLARMPELGTLNRTQAAALAGLAPFNGDSGTLRGKRTIFGGRRGLRCGLLQMPALVAARHNLILRNFYQRLRSNGKPHKVALTAVMRKLLLVLNHTLKPTACFA